MAIDHGFMEKLTALCKRRGFIYQSSEIYGGIGGFWDYGPLGVELKRNIKDLWWHDMVTNPPIGPDGRQVEMVGLDCSIIMNPKVWEASGHTTGFADPMVDCRESKQRYRADQLMVIDPAPAGHRPGSESAWNRLFAFVDDDPASYEAALRKAKHFARKLGVALPEPPPVLPLLRVLEKVEQLADIVGPHAENPGTLTEPRQFNLMFKTYVGALEDAASVAYLRPETAQGIFANFKNVLDTTRVKIPFGIAQIGKSFRNEINPRNYTFRSREFEQMEIEFFCRGTEAGRQAGAPGEVTDMDWYAFWRKVRYDWYVNLGLKSEKLRLRDQGPDELAHYSRACADIEYLFPFSDDFQELEGVAHRGNFDLTQHQKFSGKDLTYFDAEAWERDKAARAAGPEGPWSKEEEKELKSKPPYRFLPTVIEPSAGVDRAALAFLCEAYCEDQAPDENGVMQARVVMKFHPKLAPIKVAVFPLVSREGMPDIAEAIYKDVKKHMPAFFDEKGAIGRRYRRQDEAGTPFCVTVDGQTLKDGTVTIRDRDTLRQVRVSKEGVVSWLKERIQGADARD